MRAVFPVLLAAALAVRLWGIDYGLPFFLVSDEEVMLGGAMRMYELGILVPALHAPEMSILYYPVGLPYLYALLIAPVTAVLAVAHGLPDMGTLKLLVLDNLGWISGAARLSSVLFAGGTIIVIYRLGATLTTSPAAGAMAAALIGADYMHAMLSHVARHWSATVFIIWLTAWLAYRYFQRPSAGLAAAIGLLGGYGFGVSYIGALGCGFAAVAHLRLSLDGRQRFFSRPLFAMIAGFAAIALLLTLLYPEPMFRLLFGVLPITAPKTFAGWIDSVMFYVRALWWSNPPLLLLAAAGLVVTGVRRRWWILGGGLAGVVGYTLFLYKFMPIEDRYILPLSPLLALSGGLAFAELHARLPRRGAMAVTTVVVAVVLAYPAAISARAAQLMARTDTRQMAMDWLMKSIDPTERVLIVSTASRLEPTLAAIDEQVALEAGSLKAVDRLRRQMAVEPADGRFSVNLSQLSPAVRDRMAQPEEVMSLASRFSYYVADQSSVKELGRMDEVLSRHSQPIIRFQASETGIRAPYLRSTTLVPYPLHHLFELDRLGPEVVISRLTVPRGQ